MAAAVGGSVSSKRLVVDRLFPSELAKQYFFDSSPNVLMCGLPNSGKSSIIDVVFYKASPHETLSFNPSTSSCIHSIAHTPFFRCTIIDLVIPNAASSNTGGPTNTPRTATTGSPGNAFNSEQNINFHFANLPIFSQAYSTLSVTNQLQTLNAADSHSNASNDLLNVPANDDKLPTHCYNELSNKHNPHLLGPLDSSNAEAEEIFFKRIDSIILVVDSQNDSFINDINYSKEIFRKAWKYNKNVKLEVFLHKIDGDVFTSDEYHVQSQQLMYEKLFGILEEEKIKDDILFHSTSIYDHTIFEAISRVFQNLSSKVLAYGQLLDTLVGNCKMEHAILMDTHTKTFIATDCTAFDPFNYELSSEMIDVMMEISCIYADSSQPNTPSSHTVNKNTLEQLAQSQKHSTVVGGVMDTIDQAASCSISLNTGIVLYSTEIDRFIVLICIVRSENFEFQHLVDYNIRVFTKAALQLVSFK